MTCFISLKNGSNLWIAEWTKNENIEQNNYYLMIYSILSLSYGFLIIIRVGVLLLKTYLVAKKVHTSIIINLLYAPIVEFFERIPLGRILNRLS